MLFAGSGGFNLDFPCHVDLSLMAQVRAVLVRPDGSRVNRDIAGAVVSTLTVGSVLPVPIEAEDFPNKGHYNIQVGALDSGGTPIYFDPIQVEILDPVVPDFWA